jgi:hypothetical protein
MNSDCLDGAVRRDAGTCETLKWMCAQIERHPQRAYELVRGVITVAEGLAADAELVTMIEQRFRFSEFWWFDRWGPGLWFDRGVVSWEPCLVYGYFDGNFPESVRAFFAEQRVRQISALTTFEAAAV